MKKNSLLNAILIVLAVIFTVSGVLGILGYFVPAIANKFMMLPVFDVVLNFVQSFQYFFDSLVFILVLGAFYGVMNKIPAYKKLIDNVCTKLKNKGNIFVYVTIILFAMLAFVTGLSPVLLVFVPFFVAIILGLGYDKLVAVTSTVVSIMLGIMSSFFLSFRDPNSYYGYADTTIEKLLGITNDNVFIAKGVLLIAGIALLIFFVNRYLKDLKDKKVKYELNESDEVEVSEVDTDYKNIRVWPIVLVFVLLLAILVLGYMPWKTLFNIDVFEKFNTWLVGLKIKDFPLFTNVIFKNAMPFGTWAAMGTYTCTIISMLVVTILFKFIYRVKLSDIANNFANGAKKVLPAVLLINLSYSILVCTLNTGFMNNLIEIVSKNAGINIGVIIICSIIGLIFVPDLYYSVVAVLLPITQAANSDAMIGAYALTFQNMYGLISMIAPTSVILIFALKYFDIPYASWVKYIWRFILMLFLVVVLILLVLALI